MFWRLLYTLPNFLAGFGMLVVACLAFQHRQMRGGPVFFLMALASSLWAFTEGLSFVGLAPDTIRLIWMIQYLGVVSAPVLLAVFALQYVSLGFWLSWRVKLTLAIFPLFVLAAAWTNDAHHLVWARLFWDETTPFPTLAGRHGPLVWLLLAYHYVILLCTGIVLIHRRASQPPKQQRQINLLLLAGIIPMFASGIYMARIVPLRNMDLAPLAINFSVALLAWGVVRERILSLIPVARHEIYQSLEDAVFVLDSRHCVVDINPAVTKLFGFDLRHTNGVYLLDLIPEIQGLITRGYGKQELKRNGCWYDVRISVLFSSEGRPIGSLLVWRDVSGYKIMEAELKRLAATDSLTGFANHRQFYLHGEKMVSQSVRYDHPLSLIMLDLDFFKSINDTHGHQKGDDVLIAVADACRGVLRACDVAGRIGGEEFAVLLPETPSDAGVEVGARLQAAISGLEFDGVTGSFKVTASIGVSTLDDANRNFEVMLATADAALYEAKSQGRNCLVLK